MLTHAKKCSKTPYQFINVRKDGAFSKHLRRGASMVAPRKKTSLTEKK